MQKIKKNTITILLLLAAVMALAAACTMDPAQPQNRIGLPRNSQGGEEIPEDIIIEDHGR